MSSPFLHKHLYSVEPLSGADIQTIFDVATKYAMRNRSSHKKCDKLAGKTIVNMFFEESTRTRTSFEIAAKRLGADVVNFTATSSSMKKGETLSDTLHVINAMQVEAFVIRHSQDGIVKLAIDHIDGSVLNAGDGANEHPTQALLDALTMKRHKGEISGLNVAICGDIKHSRVARSNALLLKKFGADVRFFAPPQFQAHDTEQLGARLCSSMEEALHEADVVMMLRIQNERLQQGEFSMNAGEYHTLYGLDHAKLKPAKKDVIVMHPAPMNRGIEISDALADDLEHSVVFEQMEVGVAVRMACLDLLLTRSQSS